MSLQSPDVSAITQKIINSSSSELRQNPVVPDIVLQEGAILLKDKRASLALNPHNLVGFRNEIITPEDALLSLVAGERLGDMVGLSSLARQLEDMITQKAGAYQLFDFSKSLSYASPIQEQTIFIEALLPDKSKLINEFAQAEAKMNILLSLLPAETSVDDQILLRNRTLAWQKIIGTMRKNILGIAESDLIYQQQLASTQKELEYPDETAPSALPGKKSYKTRLVELINDPVRLRKYSGIIYGEDNAQQRTKDMTSQFLETALSLNRARVLNRLHDPRGEGEGGALDLVKSKKQALLIIAQSDVIKGRSDLTQEEKQRQLQELDTKLISLWIPIANKVAAVFPHDSVYTLSAILAQDEAICSGKTEALIAVSRFLGLNGRSVIVNTTLCYDSAHTVFEVDLVSQNKLIIDANSDLQRDLKDLSDEELLLHVNGVVIPKIEREKGSGLNVKARSKVLADYMIYRDNANSVLPGSNVLIYTESQSDQPYDQSYTLKKGEFWRIDSHHGNKVLWNSSVTHPHRLIAPDKDGAVSSSIYFNLGLTLVDQPEAKEEAEAFLRKAIEMNPGDIDAHYRLGYLLSNINGRGKDAELSYQNCVLLCNMLGLEKDKNYCDQYRLASSYMYSNGISF